jgi:hypothetical protein
LNGIEVLFYQCPFSISEEELILKTLQQGLKKWAKENNIQSPQETQPREKKAEQRQKEKLTDRDIRELMGIGKPIYRRGKGGSFRQK